MSQESSNIGMNELVNYEKNSYSKWMKGIMEFLWKCGGSDKKILEFSPYSDHIKHAGIGGVVLATTVMAMIAMGFAMHTIFASPDPSGALDPITGEVALKGNWLITLPVSVVWGLIIFNLDRFIVSTVKGDGTEAITIWKNGKSELLTMIPRLLMAIIIGLTISAPLETFIFKREIYREWKLSMDQLAISKTYEIKQTESVRTKEIDEALAKLENDFQKQATIVEDLRKAYVEETTGLRGGRGEGPEARAIKTQLEKEEKNLSMIDNQRDELRVELAKKQKDTKKQQDEMKKKITGEKPGFLDQIMMLERLSHNGKSVPKFDPVKNEVIKGKKDEIYGKASAPIWLVRFLFMIVEIAPVIFKFMLNKSSYDWMHDNVSQILEAKQGISLKEVTDENNNMHRYRENYNAIRIAEVARHQNELEKENSKHAMNLYAAKEKGEMDNDIDKFIKND
ncbi:MAG: DUF4407 domain-containing protein [Crocinitomicaceae bacterium]|jgi:hypothetical protein